MGQFRLSCATVNYIVTVLGAIVAVNQAVVLWSPPAPPTTTGLPTGVSCPNDMFDFKKDLGLLNRELSGFSVPGTTFHQLLSYAHDILRYRRNVYVQLNASYISRLRNSRIEIDLHFQSMLDTHKKNLKRFGTRRTKPSRYYYSSLRRHSASSGRGGPRNTTKTSPSGTNDFKASSPQSRATSWSSPANALPPCVRVKQGRRRLELIKKTVVLLLLALPMTEDELNEAALEEDLEYYFLRSQGRNLIHLPEDRTAACPPCYMRGTGGKCRQLFFCRNGKNISRVIQEVTVPPSREG